MADTNKKDPKETEDARAKKEAAERERAAKKAQGEAKKTSAKAAREGKPKKEKAPKMSREEKKALLERQKKREKELVEAGEIPRRNEYRPRGIFWRIFGICLAFFMGIFACLGGIVCAGLILLNRPSRELLGQFGLEAEELISEDYLDKTVFELYGDLAADINLLGDPASLTLGTFSKYTPLIDTYLNDFIDTNLKALGIELDLSDIKSQKFTELGAYVKSDLLPQIKLGPVLGLDTEVTLQKVEDNSPLYTLSYGKFGVDYTIADDQTVQMAAGKSPKAITDLIPTLAEDGAEAEIGIMDVLGDTELGALLGLDLRLPSEQGQDNAMLYSLCYGTEGVDYHFEDIDGGQILKLHDGKTATTVGDLMEEETRSTIIDGLALADLITIGPDTEPALRTIAYGAEMAKDENGQYLIDPATGKYQTETVTDEDGNRTLQYVGGGRYIIEGTGEGAKIVMLPDPNDTTGKTYSKKTIGDLKDSDGILKDVTIGSLIEIGEDSSAIMKALKNWTVNDLTDKEKVNGLKFGEVIDLGENPSGILSAIQNWEIRDLNDQRHIDRIKIGSIIDGTTSGLMKAIKDWSIQDLNSEEKIDSLTIGDVVTIGPDSPQMLQAMRNMTLGEVSSDIDTLTLNDVLGPDTFDGSNKILETLRYCRIRNLGTEIDALTVEDVFGEDIWSYSKTYVSGTRPADSDKISGAVTKKYYFGGVELTPGYYTADGTRVPDADVTNDAYLQRTVYLTRTPKYYFVDYTKAPAEWTEEYSGDVMFDNYTAYCMEGGVRRDLETVYAYKTADGADATGKTILVERHDTGEADRYYYIEKTPVSYRYAAPDGTLYTADQVTETYFYGNTEVQRYHAGAWYLLLGEPTAQMPKLTEMGGLVGDVAHKIDTMTLGMMYAHEITSRDPDVNIARLTANIPSLSGKTNLSQLTVNEVILLISSLAAN